MRSSHFECPYNGCNRIYNSQQNLDNHIEATHKEAKRFVCSFCNRVLSSQQNLREHTYTHTGECPYKCKEPGCNMTFRQGSQLSAHKKVHQAIQRSSSDNQFVELKLTQRLERCPTPQKTEEVQVRVEVEPLPLINGVVNMGPLPLFKLSK